MTPLDKFEALAATLPPSSSQLLVCRIATYVSDETASAVCGPSHDPVYRTVIENSRRYALSGSFHPSDKATFVATAKAVKSAALTHGCICGKPALWTPHFSHSETTDGELASAAGSAAAALAQVPLPKLSRMVIARWLSDDFTSELTAGLDVSYDDVKNIVSRWRENVSVSAEPLYDLFFEWAVEEAAQVRFR